VASARWRDELLKAKPWEEIMDRSPSLPQHDAANADDRKQQLYASRQQYQYDHDYLSPLAVLFVPHAFPPTHEEDVIGPLRDLPDDQRVAPEYLFPRWAPAFSTLLANIGSIPRKLDPGLRAYEQLFPVLPPPRSIGHWQDDAYFASQRLNGPNPMVIRQVRRRNELPEQFAITDSLFQRVTGATLGNEIAEGRVFVSDYALLASAQGIHTFPDKTTRYMPAPFGLFWWNPAQARLAPVAIQLERAPSEKNPVYTPRDDPAAWLRAKVFFQVADLNFHELSTHLCRTHFGMETFVVAMGRQLVAKHPVHVLLTPHFEAMVYNNFRGRQVLVNQGGTLAQVLSVPLDLALDVISQSYRTWDFRQLNPDTELAERMPPGPLDGTFFYRSDALAVWKAVQSFVRQYVQVYFRSDADVANDTEIQGWARELASPSGGNVRGFPDRIETVEQLVSVLAPIIFTCGPQHAAVNFPQWDYVGFTPNMPGYARQAPWEAKNVLDILPVADPTSQAGAIGQLSTVYTLTCYRYGRLGEYPTITDPSVQPAVKSFQGVLSEIHTTIGERNKKLPPEAQYPYLDPPLIPNSNNI
jgi:arachidonate 15-lipoxygenase